MTLNIKDLPVGKCIYQEFDAPEGTLINEDVIYDFEITDHGMAKAGIKDELILSIVLHVRSTNKKGEPVLVRLLPRRYNSSTQISA